MGRVGVRSAHSLEMLEEVDDGGRGTLPRLRPLLIWERIKLFAGRDDAGLPNGHVGLTLEATGVAERAELGLQLAHTVDLHQSDHVRRVLLDDRTHPRPALLPVDDSLEEGNLLGRTKGLLDRRHGRVALAALERLRAAHTRHDVADACVLRLGPAVRVVAAHQEAVVSEAIGKDIPADEAE
jgi:hypothetical protein